MGKESLIIPDKIKTRLYPVVLNEFSNKDFHEVNIREISKLSGLSTGTIYKYFKSKEDILFKIIDENLLELGKRMRLHIRGMEDTKEIFRKLFFVTMDFFDENPDLAVAAFITAPLKNFMKSSAYRRETEIDILNEVVTNAKEKSLVDPDIENRYFADLYFMIAQRHIHNWYYCGKKWKLANTINEFFNFFWKIVKPLSK